MRILLKIGCEGALKNSSLINLNGFMDSFIDALEKTSMFSSVNYLSIVFSFSPFIIFE